jgi:membrane protein implicated in regulation of membrane protease activity
VKKNVYFGLWIIFLIATLVLAGYVCFFLEGSKTAWTVFILVSAIFSSRSYTVWRKEKRNENQQEVSQMNTKQKFF